jgi:hypothetical protein
MKVTCRKLRNKANCNQLSLKLQNNIFIKSIWLLAAWILASGHAIADSEITPAKITVYVTVDWEGAALDNHSMEAMQDFRKKYPHIAMLQLITPSYWLQPNIDKAAVTAQIKSTFLPIDQVGLHLHAWKSLVNFCQVPYQHAPSFADQNETCEVGDCGYSVSLEYAYSQAELTKLVACSSDLLVQQGFAKPVHFRAGGWQLGSKLMAALQHNDFIWDSSRTDASLLTTRWHVDSGMIKMVSELHPNSSPLDQPYAIDVHMMEFPNNASLADYTSTKQIVEMFNTLIKNNKTVMVLGFHQETANEYLPRLDVAIPQLEAAAKAANIQIEWASR